VRYVLQNGEVTRQQLDEDAVVYRRDARGFIVEVQDPNGKAWRLTWDEAGRLTEMADPAGHTFRVTYDQRGALLAVEEPDGARMEVEYDAQGRPIRLRAPDGAEIRLEYDAHGQLVAWVDPLGHRTTFAYDDQGRLTEMRLPDGATYTYRHEANRVVETDPAGRTTVYEFDNEDRLLAVRRNGHVLRLDYTPDGKLVALEDAQGRRIQAEYDPRGLPVAFRFPNGLELRQVYDVLGRPVELRTAQGRVMFKRTYDKRGRLIALTDAKGNSWRYEYDKAGNLVALTDRKGRTYRFEYDEAYRPIRIYDPEGRVQVAVEYDEVGQPRRMTDAEGHTMAFTFDALGRLIATAWDGDEARAELDPAGRLARLIDEKGRVRTYAYDPRGNLIRETYPLNQTYTYAYDPAGRLTRQTLPDGTQVDFVYDALDRLVSLTYRRNGRSAAVQYVYGPDGRSMVLRDATGEVRYILDENERYLERRDVFGQSVRYEFPPEGRVQRLVYPDGKAVEYEYDANGNLTRIRDFAGHETHIEYDEQDLPIRVEHPGGLVSLYEYDAQDRVVRIRHLDAQGNLLVEQRLQRDATGRVVAAYDYAAYGQMVGRYGENVPFRFLGRWGIMGDHEGLYYIRARYYAPRLGFFTQPDRLHVRAPLPRFLNRYAYALDDPWNLVDINGQAPVILVILGTIALGGVTAAGSEVFGQIVFEGKSWNTIEWGRVVTAGISGSAGTGAGLVTGNPFVAGAVSGAVNRILDNVFIDNRPWYEGVVRDLVFGGVTAYVGGKLLSKAATFIGPRLPWRPVRAFVSVWPR